MDHPDKLQAEHERMLELGYVEGPLLYRPHIVQSLGGVWNDARQKWRTIMDATSSGVNPACQPLPVKYDMLGDALAKLTPGCLMSTFDKTDAFLHWPYDQEHAELMGYADINKEYFRYRYMAFGVSQSPYFQQKWGLELKRIVNEHGLKYCRPRSSWALRWTRRRRRWGSRPTAASATRPRFSTSSRATTRSVGGAIWRLSSVACNGAPRW